MGDYDAVYSLKLHYGELWKVLDGIDPDRYSLVVLKSDFTEIFMADAEGWKRIDLYITCQIPERAGIIELNTEQDVQEMFRLCRGQQIVKVYGELRQNVDVLKEQCVDGAENINIGTTKKRVRRKKDSHAGRKNKESGMLLRKCSMSAINAPEPEEEGRSSDDDSYVESSDESENDKDMPNKLDRWLNKYTEDGSEIEIDDGIDLGSDDDGAFVNDSDNDGDYHPLRKCLNREEFQFCEGETVRLKEKMIFKSKEDLKEALIDYTIQEGFQITWLRSESRRVTVVCKDEKCPWRMHSSRLPDGYTFCIKNLNDVHTCRMEGFVLAPRNWIAKRILNTIKADRDVSNSVLLQNLKQFGVQPKKHQLLRSRQRALELIDGNHADSFKLLPQYCLEVIKSNPGSVAKIEYCMPVPKSIPSVKRMFIGFDAAKQGFLGGCRPYIGLDGCHLKGHFAGVLLSAIGNDPDGGFFPLAVAYVEGESKDSWLFFFNMMKEFLGEFSTDREWTFMTDRQKGLGPAITEALPHADQRKCSRHIYANFRKKYSAISFQKLFWNASMAYNHRDFRKAMNNIKELSEEAHEYLTNIGDSRWARYAFSKTLKCANVTNNPSESFNNWLGNIRHLPINTLFEKLRCKIMCRMSTRYGDSVSWTSAVCPRTDEVLKIVAKQARRVTFYPSSDVVYEIQDGESNYKVNLHSRTCDCGIWDHTGIPCKHAAAVLMHKRYPLHEYCDPMLSKGAFDKAYAHMISPVPHKSFWRESELGPCNPPKLKRRIGRPTKNRAKESWEGDKKRSNTHRCSKCFQFGHNKKTCAGGPTAKEKKAAEMRNKKNQDGLSGQPAKTNAAAPNQHIPVKRNRKRKEPIFQEISENYVSEEASCVLSQAKATEPGSKKKKTRHKKKGDGNLTQIQLEVVHNVANQHPFARTTADKEAHILEENYASTIEPPSPTIGITQLEPSQLEESAPWENNQFDFDLNFEHLMVASATDIEEQLITRNANLESFEQLLEASSSPKDNSVWPDATPSIRPTLAPSFSHIQSLVLEKPISSQQPCSTFKVSLERKNASSQG